MRQSGGDGDARSKVGPVTIQLRACARTGMLLLVLAVAGCGQPPTPPPPSPATNGIPVAPPEPSKSAVGTVIDGLTGKTAVDAGKRARSEIDRIGKQEQKDVADAMQP